MLLRIYEMVTKSLFCKVWAHCAMVTLFLSVSDRIRLGSAPQADLTPRPQSPLPLPCLLADNLDLKITHLLTTPRLRSNNNKKLDEKGLKTKILPRKAVDIN